MCVTDNLEQMLQSLGFDLPNNIKQDITFNLQNNKYINKHCSFILDLKTRKVLCYEFNVFFKSNSFPFSIHAEIQSIVKYYKSRSITKNKKILFVIKLSKTGIVGNSKCCLNCMRFIRNNLDNLNLKKIFCSTVGNGMIELPKSKMIDENFKSSKGYMWRELASRY